MHFWAILSRLQAPLKFTFIEQLSSISGHLPRAPALSHRPHFAGHFARSNWYKIGFRQWVTIQFSTVRICIQGYLLIILIIYIIMIFEKNLSIFSKIGQIFRELFPNPTKYHLNSEIPFYAQPPSNNSSNPSGISF